MNIGFIGCGNMGGALARAINCNMQINIYISDHDREKAANLAREIGGKNADNITVSSVSDILFIGVKPSYVGAVAQEISGSLKEGALIVSMAAGVTTETLRKYFGDGKRIIRIMPNTPVKAGLGMTAWCSTDNLSEDDTKKFESIMMPTGILSRLPEGSIDAECAVAGCGPAFVYMFIEALADGGVKCGLTRENALLYAAQTVKGAAEMVLTTGEHPGALKDAVCSPGGSTIEGVAALEDGGLRASVIDAVGRAFDKTKKLG